MALLETSDGQTIGAMHESLRDFVREAVMYFTPAGLKLHGRDSAKVVIVRYSITAEDVAADGLGVYQCSKPMIAVGIDTKIVAVCLSNVASGDTVRFSVDPDKEPDRLVIVCQNKKTGKKTCYNVVTPDIEDADDPLARAVIETMNYNNPVRMSSTLFHEMMRDLSKTYLCEYRPDDKAVRVCCDGQRLVLVAQGKLISSSFEVVRDTGKASSSSTADRDSSMVGGEDGDEEDEGSPVQVSAKGRFGYDPRPADRWPVCERFAIAFFQKVAKAKNVSPEISIAMQPSFPIICTYTAGIGTISYIISFKDDEEWIAHPDQRRMPPAVEDTGADFGVADIVASVQRQMIRSPSSAAPAPRGSENEEGEDEYGPLDVDFGAACQEDEDADGEEMYAAPPQSKKMRL